jgi:hypothetical protein
MRADPLLYDRCIRHFQSAAEREREGKSKGYSGVLEADLWRGEARLDALARQHPDGIRDPAEGISTAERTGEATVIDGEVVSSRRWDGVDAEGTDEEEVKSKEQGEKLWQAVMRRRFLAGQDGDFDYGPVDANEALDVTEERERADAWFEDEEPAWTEGEGGREGETGVQDF